MMVYNESTPLWQLQDDARTERLYFPWRRLFARTMDLVFYTLLWWTVAYLVFHWNVLLLHWILCSAVMLVISLAVMIALEPLLLFLFGTTPGKALFGIRLRKIQGGRLSVTQGYKRIFRVFSHGCGYAIVPGYNFVRMYKSCKACQVDGVTEWDKGVAYTFGGKFYVQIGLSVISAILVAILLTAVYYGADMPIHRGQLTASQLEENVDSYWQYHGTAWNTELFYTVVFLKKSDGHIFDRMDPPEVVYEETGGIVTGVRFEFTDVSRTVLMALPVWLRCYTVSFIGAQSDMSFLEIHAPGGVLDKLLTPVNTIIDNREGTESVRFTAAGIEICLDITAGEHISASFSLRKV
jgi:membrane protein implicated in regulation of membrane protease activity